MTPKEQYLSDMLDARAQEVRDLRKLIYNLERELGAVDDAARRCVEAYDAAHKRYARDRP